MMKKLSFIHLFIHYHLYSRAGVSNMKPVAQNRPARGCDLAPQAINLQNVKITYYFLQSGSYFWQKIWLFTRL